MKVLTSAMLLCVLLPSLTAQRPRTVEAAVEAFEKVRGDEERSRHGAARDLGRFAEDAATRILIAELGEARSISYRTTVVKALGNKQRNGAVDVLVEAFRNNDNARFGDAVAEALRKQGQPGVAALVAEFADCRGQKIKRQSISYALARVVSGDASRDALLLDVQRTRGSDRRTALASLAGRRGDAKVDEVRVALVGDKDRILAATALRQLATHQHERAPELALQLARSLPATAFDKDHAAVVAALLVGLEPPHYDDLLKSGARALDPFGKDNQPGWIESFQDGQLLPWLAAQAGSRKSIDERVVAARALAYAPKEQGGAAGDALRKLLTQKDARVVRAAATSLLAVDPGAATEAALQAVLGKGLEASGPAAVYALHSLKKADATWMDQLLELAKHKRGAIRTAALRALGSASADPEKLLAAAKDNLRHRDWPVRAAAIALLVASRSKQAPPLLFAMLDKEKARMREDVRTALRDLTGQQFAKKADWQAWWSKEGESFRPRPAKSGRPGRDADAKTVSYWNMPVLSDRVAFLVDVSGSMAKPFGTGNGTRLDEAKRQLRLVFEQLPKTAKANLVTFSDSAEALFPKLQKVGGKQRKLADTRLEELASRGPTNVHDALEVAFGDRDVDTLFLLTDGRPSSGPIVDWTELADEVARWNAGRSIAIHTIAIGEKSDFLERLARESGGEHRVAR